MTILVSIQDPEPGKWSKPLQSLLSDHHVFTLSEGDSVDRFKDGNIRYILAWKPPEGLFGNLPDLEVIFSLGAGVDHLLNMPELPDVPIVRYVDSDLTMRMGEWIVLQVLFHLRQQSTYRKQQSNRIWKALVQPPASDVSVGIMGLGVLGTHVSKLLKSIGFQVCGWSRSPKDIENVESFAGNESLQDFLNRTDILVNVLPYTQQTHEIIDLNMFRQLRGHADLGGAFFINAGRGKSHVESDIVIALDEGILAGVSLDVFESEPLPESSPLWNNPKVILTPHVAADSDPVCLAEYVAEKIKKYENEGVLDNKVDRTNGY